MANGRGRVDDRAGLAQAQAPPQIESVGARRFVRRFKAQFPASLLMGRPRKNGRLSCVSNQLGLDTKPRGKSVSDLYEKYAVQVSPQLASDRVLGRRKEQCNSNFSDAHVLRTTL
jgi:hypothetical protein